MSKVKRWDKIQGARVESPQKVEDFIAAYDELCRVHGLTLSHEDGHGCFIIENLSERNLDRVKDARLRLED
jgi:hypothetical protein